MIVSADRLVVVGGSGSIVETARRQTVRSRRINVAVVRLDAAGQRRENVRVSTSPQTRVRVPQIQVVVIVPGNTAAPQLNTNKTA